MDKDDSLAELPEKESGVKEILQFQYCMSHYIISNMYGKFVFSD